MFEQIFTEYVWLVHDKYYVHRYFVRRQQIHDCQYTRLEWQPLLDPNFSYSLVRPKLIAAEVSDEPATHLTFVHRNQLQQRPTLMPYCKAQIRLHLVWVFAFHRQHIMLALELYIVVVIVFGNLMMMANRDRRHSIHLDNNLIPMNVLRKYHRQNMPTETKRERKI